MPKWKRWNRQFPEPIRMAEYPLGKNLSDGQVWSDIAQRKALMGEIPVECIKQPGLLKSASRTPKPDLD